MTLKVKMAEYLGKLRALNVPLLKFDCPYCKAELETEANTTNADWDSLSECWECNKTFFKITPASSQPVIAVLPGTFRPEADESAHH